MSIARERKYDLPRGVYLKHGRFEATAKWGGRYWHLGTFSTKEEASAAYEAARAAHPIAAGGRPRIASPDQPALPPGIYRKEDKFRVEGPYRGKRSYIGTFATLAEAEARLKAANDAVVSDPFAAAPPCSRCGDTGGALNKWGKPDRIDGKLVGIAGKLCRQCYRGAYNAARLYRVAHQRKPIKPAATNPNPHVRPHVAAGEEIQVCRRYEALRCEPQDAAKTEAVAALDRLAQRQGSVVCDGLRYTYNAVVAEVYRERHVGPGPHTVGQRIRIEAEYIIAFCVVCGKELEGHGKAKTCGDECGKKRKAETAAQWNAANPEKARERDARSYAAHGEKKRKYNAEYRARHKSVLLTRGAK